jgi:PAS domain S-box-containing protein
MQKAGVFHKRVIVGRHEVKSKNGYSGCFFKTLLILFAALVMLSVNITCGRESCHFEAGAILNRIENFVFANELLLTLVIVSGFLFWNRKLKREIKLRKASEKALLESENRFQKVFEHAPNGKSITSIDGTLHYNKEFCLMLGYSPDELQEFKWMDITHPEDIELTWKNINPLLNGERETARFEKRYIHKNGSIIWADVLTYLERDKNNKPEYFITTVIDITERKKREEILEARIRLFQFADSHTLNELLEEVLNEVEIISGSTISFFHFIDADQKNLTLHSWSTSTKNNYCRAEGLGGHYEIAKAGVWVDCVHQREPVVHNDYSSLPYKKGLPEGHAALTRDLVVPVIRGENIKAVMGVGNKKINYDDVDIAVVSSFADLAWDIAERKLFSEEFKRSNDELQQFAYVASHDLQEPLRMISSYLQLIEARYKDKLDDDANVFINFAVEGAVRLQSLISDLLEYSKINSTRIPARRININNIIDRVLGVFENIIRDSHTSVEYGSLPEITGDREQIFRLFQNLIHNGIKYRREGIKPHIIISAEESGMEYIFRVSDNGIGIESGYFEKIFIVFQRLHTLKKYPGTGIGLSICKKIVERHGGRIWVESKPGEGTSICFTLPAGKPPNLTAPAPPEGANK